VVILLKSLLLDTVPFITTPVPPRGLVAL
jgi:hypothetical protein